MGGVAVMKYYKNTQGEVYAYETEADRVTYGAKELVKMTQQEIDAHLNPPCVEPVPEFVTRSQGKAALITEGLWKGVLDYVDSIEDATQKALAEVALNDTTHWQRTSPFLKSAATYIGLSDKQLDDLFIKASEIYL